MSKRIRSALFHVCCLTFGLTTMYPLFWMIASSLKDTNKVFVDASNLFPNPPHFDNYARGWKGFGHISFATFFGNSLFVVILTSIGVLLSCSFIAFGFARMKFKGRNFWFTTVIVSMMLPGQLVMIPQYIIFHTIHWDNTYLPLIVPAYFGGGFFIFLMMQFIRGIPYDLDEAAKLDGCNPFSIYFRIILPLTKSALITAAIFQFYWSWEDFMAPMIYLSNPKLYTVSLALRMFSDPSQTDWSAMFAMSTLSVLPPVIVFFIFQKYIVEGISTSGMKA
jgi:multiple sugar transport system permease protein